MAARSHNNLMWTGGNQCLPVQFPPCPERGVSESRLDNRAFPEAAPP
ncbi:hypothetical protein CGRA01v4_08076 [Colletotrichum graminicola]|nr:hypothetical protein CGRA01v4_08076 [Colletotrichum graminicola]